MSKQQKRWALWLALALLLAAVVGVTYEVAQRAAIASLRDATASRLDLYSESVRSELRRYEYLPQVVALSAEVGDLLAIPDDQPAQRRVNAYLETVSDKAGAAAVYVIDRTGMTLAASNWKQPVSFVGTNFSYRPYFQEAIRGGEGRFYGIGTVSREPGYYYSHGISREGEVVGVAAVKVNLDRIDLPKGDAGEKVIVVDRNGVIFLSSDPAWRFKTVTTLSHEAVGKLQSTRQYSEAGQLASVGLQERRGFADGTSIVSVTGPQAGSGTVEPVSYVAQRRPIAGTDWQITVLSDLERARTAARASVFVATLVTVLLGLVSLYFLQRRRFVEQLMNARGALQRANDELERKVASRTSDLSAANGLLETEIAERRRAEESLKAATNELVQTAKMAVLGQMSAGITHELNQPLAALRTLSSNTAVFLRRGQHQEVESNLRVIGELTEHMGKITSELKKFARKAPVELRPVPVMGVVNDAAFLLAQTDRGRRLVSITADSVPAVAWCDHTRLEQVIVNLLTNAFDAVEKVASPQVQVRVRAGADDVVIEIHDNGPGLSEEVTRHLFEPFFTTKGQGSGLGLGLAISAGIVRDFGGTLFASRSPLGGALFVIELGAVLEVPEHG